MELEKKLQLTRIKEKVLGIAYNVEQDELYDKKMTVDDLLELAKLIEEFEPQLH